MSQTSIRVTVDTRDRLSYLSQQREDPNLDVTVNFLLDELWKARCIDQADRLRDDDPGTWRSDLNASQWQDRQLSRLGDAA